MKTEILPGTNVAECPVSERRSHLRRNVLFSCAELGQENGGIVLDLSESGFGLQAIAALTHDELPAIRFQFAPTYSWIDSRGRIAWKSDSMMVAGVEFIDLPEAAREQIRKWISLGGNRLREEKPRLDNSAQSDWTMPVSAPISGPPVPNLEPTELHALDRSQKLLAEPVFRIGAENWARSSGKPCREIGFSIFGILFMLLLLALFPPRHSTNSASNVPKRPEMTVASKQPEVSSSDSEKPSIFEPKPSSVYASNRPGLVLQVGAMKHQENADALADSLRHSNFPVTVILSGNRRFYRVVVGPYSDVASTLRVKDQLKQRGFDAFGMTWNPPGQ